VTNNAHLSLSAFVRLVGLVGLVGLASCRSQPPDPTTGPQTAAPPPASMSAAPVARDSGAEAAATAMADAAAPAAPEEPLAGVNLVKEIQAAFRVAACSGDDGFIPKNIDKKVVDTHCGMLASGFAEYKREWVDVAGPFIAKFRPAGLPTTIVYPFGGGDLMSALATYPDGTEFTTISLEVAGDVRGVMKTDSKRLEKELSTLRDHLGKLFLKAHSRTINLDIETRGAIPGEIAFSMAALAIHGFEPVSLRYFEFEPDGKLHWATEEDIANADKAKTKKLWNNAEIRFKKAGEPRVRVLRHVAYDLSDGNLRRSPALVKHLETKPKVSAMTKAASHLLWDDKNFSIIRDYLMSHTDWMISDTTGVPPRVAKKNGFVQDVYGLYEWPEPFGTVNNDDAKAFHELFKSSSAISFRYGYPDNRSHGHIVVTRKPDIGGIKP
jgi:hypothetical protein